MKTTNVKKIHVFLEEKKKIFNENCHSPALFSYCAFYGMPVMPDFPLCFLTVQHTQAGAESLEVKNL